ncbi:hypothetical protein [Solirubrum puertoriconensis]|uniref:Uncharacterized protein n=1 Tax=Solirubrum puertoriconensis TaxID=1751427 RepID=A0A9X0L4X6_SOLP1|nr:hypothetical protein [Solirubrum puertoriconensis]KUG08102.1 hypothetical protein ASU33_07850 [Solirubrum puertoriconensis]
MKRLWQAVGLVLMAALLLLAGAGLHALLVPVPPARRPAAKPTLLLVDPQPSSASQIYAA